MSVVAQQFAFPWDIPQAEPKRVKTKWQELQEMTELSQDDERSGGLVPLNICPILLDVSQQRVGQLLDAGKLEAHEFFGRKFVTINSLADWINSERKNGRPVKNPPTTLREAHTRVKEHWKGKKKEK